MLKQGIYEQVMNQSLSQVLEQTTDQLSQIAAIDEAEASKVLTKYIAEVIEQGLDCVKDQGGDTRAQVELVNELVKVIKEQTGDQDFEELTVSEKAEQLLALVDKKNSIYAINNKTEIIRPETSIAQSSLFTGAIHEPQMFSELKKEIVSCDQIDLLVSFIKWSGLRLIMEELTDFTRRGGRLRVITTSYMGATDVKAIEALATLENTEIKISYDTKRTRLHAKAYVFYRASGFTTAYVGSSNLSNAAISSGLEWNVKVTQKDLPDTIKKIEGTFESYWHAREFESYTLEQKERLRMALKAEWYTEGETSSNYGFDIMPFSYQQEILDRLQAERQVRGYNHNLVVAATGTGKTVISAFDYKRFCKTQGNRPVRLLFVAHREEILKQSMACFRGVLKDPNFGELFVGNYKPTRMEHLFVSIQTFNSQELMNKTTSDFYDFIVVDEFHHAAAPTYQSLLTYYNPKILLGLTATPERMDGKNILAYFNHRIAAEIRLPEAIDRKLLCPFQYFGVTDVVDLDTLKWSRGGYDQRELERVYTLEEHAANKRADLIVNALNKYVTEVRDVKALGFCVSVKHATFMAEYFNSRGIEALFLTGESPEEERRTAKQKLVSGEVKIIFVVDLYNEGIDIPQVNTLLFLRPTESLTVFLQQLGRGLRLWEEKDCLTVLDFIGQANKKYAFEEKFRALLSSNHRGMQRELKDNFVSVPKGCYIQLERKAKEMILSNIRASVTQKSGLVMRMAQFKEETGQILNLENFTAYYHLESKTIYQRGSFSRLAVLAGVKEEFEEPVEDVLTKAFMRICAIDSRRWLSFLIQLFQGLEELELESLSKEEMSMLRMFEFTVWQKEITSCDYTTLKEALLAIKACKVLYEELMALLEYNYNHIEFIDEPVDLGFPCALDLHCTYTRDQILVALDFMKPSTVREGVKYLPDQKVDVFFVTLNKSDKEYSPTTMYNDYSINECLFHWQSQSTTAETSPTGQRYRGHKAQNSKVLLFVREFKKDVLGAAAYTYLGMADYVSHEGSRPMNIVWRLHKPIPARFIKKTNKLIVG